jgi:DNA-binding transcriptional LysR family regulator
MPQLGELMSGEPPLRFEVRSLPNEPALNELRTGRIDMAILRTELATEDLQSELLAPIQHVFAVPRALLRTKEGAEVFEGRPIPFAELGGDAFFAKTVRATATALGLNLLPVVQVESFSLLMSAVESGTAAAFLPTIAARSLPEQHFAQVFAEPMEQMKRSLSLVWYGKSAESRASVRRAVSRLKRALG